VILLDAQARRVEYLRLSLTERCNLACVYCVPEDHEALPQAWLSDDEVVALVAALIPLGLRRVRLTGGEPTLRPRLPALVGRLAALDLDDLSLTTNATRLRELAAPLQHAGLRRLNISLDTLNADRFAALAGARSSLTEVLAGIDAACAAGFASLKLNTVALAGLNEDELPALARYAWSRGIVPRFIELMPMADGAIALRGRLLDAASIRARLAVVFGALTADHAADVPGVGPARYYRTESGERVGIIAAVTERFCDSCNRIRVSARGRLHTCLGIDDPEPSTAPGVTIDPLDLRAALNVGTSAVQDAVRTALSHKPEGHGFRTISSVNLAGGPRRAMIVIGG
jgi:cyclic pyranopterin phosphate synthase